MHCVCQAIERGDSDCPICLMRLDGSSCDCLPVTCSHPHSDPPRRRWCGTAVSGTWQAATSAVGGAADKSRGEKKRQLMLLSCSHLFHATCLQAMEEFTVERTQHICPVCRSHYQTKLVGTWLHAGCWVAHLQVAPQKKSRHLFWLLTFLSASLYFSKRDAYWDRLCRDVVDWLSRACTVAKRCILGL